MSRALLTGITLAITLSVACRGKTDDADGDGVNAADDCDDNNANNYPGNAESCDGIDNDCDGIADNGVTITVYVDADGDGFGNPEYGQAVCTKPAGYVDNGDDCDDGDPDNYAGNTEVCDGGDNDCDGVVDNGVTITAYLDEDDDGFGDPQQGELACEVVSGFADNGDDCDDDDASINPAMPELCDGFDNDCDSNTSEDSMASAIDNGVITDITPHVTGTNSSPALFELSTDTVFCDGTFYVNLLVSEDLAIWSVNADAGATTLDGGGSGSVLTINTDGLEVRLQDLSLTNGLGQVTQLGSIAGGGIVCEAVNNPIELSLDGVVLHHNEAISSTEVTFGGGLFAFECDVEMTNTEVFSNVSVYGGGLSTWYSEVSLDGVTLDSNQAYVGAGWMHGDGEVKVRNSQLVGNQAEVSLGSLIDAVSFDVEFYDVIVDGNSAANGGGLGVYGDGAFTWEGSGSGSSALTSNTDDGYVGALYLDENLTATVTNVDFGTSAGGDDNSLYDLTIGDYSYTLGDAASFSCYGGTCGSPTGTYLGGTADSGSYTGFLGIAFLASTNGTLNYFAPYSYSNASTCEGDFYVVSNSSFSGGSWTVEWADTGNVTPTSPGYASTGVVGIPLESGTYYGLVWSNSECTIYYRYASSTDTSVADLGTYEGYLYQASTSITDYEVGDTITLYDGTSSSFDLRMYVNGTEL